MDFQSFLEEDARAEYQADLRTSRLGLKEKLAADGFDLSLLRNPSVESQAAWVAVREAKTKLAAVEQEGRFNARSDERHELRSHGEALLGDAADMLVQGSLSQASVEHLEKDAGAVDQFAKGFFKNVAKRAAPSKWGEAISRTVTKPSAGSAAAKKVALMSDAEKFGRGAGNLATPALVTGLGITALSSVRPENLTVEMLRELSQDKIKEARLTAASSLAKSTAKAALTNRAVKAETALAAQKAGELAKGDSFISRLLGRPHKRAAEKNLKGALDDFRSGASGGTHDLKGALQRMDSTSANIYKARKNAGLGAVGAGAGGYAVSRDGARDQ